MSNLEHWPYSSINESWSSSIYERRWRSPRTGADYPVERTVTVKLPEGDRRWRIQPLFDDQELDSRQGGGPVYWEGAVRAPGGRGYLELTGYLAPLKL
jgi:predicted secreted hydrolase